MRILIVEDEKKLNDILQRSLKSVGSFHHSSRMTGLKVCGISES
jgi:DNA-binding response OmpR family regulator